MAYFWAVHDLDIREECDPKGLFVKWEILMS